MRKLKLQKTILGVCCVLGGSAAPGLASDHALRGPISMKPSYVKLDTEASRGVSIVKSKSMFPVTLLTHLYNKTAHIGQPVEAMLIEDIAVAGKIVAPKGSRVTGWVSAVHAPRNVLESKFSSSNWLNSNGAIGIHFAKIDPTSVSKKKLSAYNIDAQPAPNTPVRGPQGEFELCVHKDGCISVKWNGIKYGAAGLAIGAVSWATGPYKLITGPVISGTAGAIKPAYALDRPVSKEDPMTRTKGCLVGAVKGLPGGILVTGMTNRGGNITIPSGVQLEVQLISDLVIPD